MNRTLTVVFAIVAAVLVATAPTAAASDKLVVASSHTTESDFSESNGATLTNVSILGTGGGASVAYQDYQFSDGFEDEPADAGVADAWEVTDTPDSQEVTTARSFTGSQSYLVNGTTTGGIVNPAEQPYRTGTTAPVNISMFNTGGGDTWLFLTENDQRIGGFVMKNGDLQYFNGSYYTVATAADDNEWVKIHVFDINPTTDTLDVYWESGDGSSGTVTDLQSDKDIAEGYDKAELRSYTKAYFDDYRIDGEEPRSAQYISANHSVSGAEKGFTNLTLENATADVRWEYHDGSSWVVANSTTYSTTGNHTLDISGTSSSTWRVNVTFNNQTGATTAELHDEGILFNPNAPELSNFSPKDGTKLKDQSTNLEVQVNDSDFGTAQGDEIALRWYVDGTHQSTTTAASNGTYSFDPGTLNGGDHEWRVEAEDNWSEVTTSATRSFKVPDTLYIYNETSPNELVNGTDSTVTVRFFADDTIVTKNTTDGKINLTGLPANKKLSIRAEADGYYSRRIIIDDLYQQQEIYLLNQSYDDVAETRFKVSDQTGQFDEPSLLIEKPIEKDGNTTWKRIVGDDTGVAGLTTHLDKDSRYRIIVRQGSNSRTLGSYTNPITETVELQVGTLTFSYGNVSGYQWDASHHNKSGAHEIRFNYSDSDKETENLKVVVHEYGNESNTLITKTYAGPVGEVSLVESLTANESEKAWVVNFTADRNGQQIAGERVVGAQRVLGTGLADIWLHTISVGMLIVVAGLFGGLNARIGAIVVPLLGGMLWFLGMLPAGVGAGVIILALGIAIFYNVRSGGVPT